MRISEIDFLWSKNTMSRPTLCPGDDDYECLALYADMQRLEQRLERQLNKAQEKCVLWQTRHNTLLNQLPPPDHLFAGQTPPNRKSTRPSKLKK